MLKIFAERSFCMNAISLHIADIDGRRRAVAEPMTFKVAEEGFITQPCLQLQPDEAQELMDQLWHCGMRPSEGSGSAGSLAATERHLADMRSIALNSLSLKP